MKTARRHHPQAEPISLTRKALKQIHELSEKCGNPAGMEETLTRIYKLERHAESVDNQHHPRALYSFAESAEEHFKVGAAESKAKHQLESILLKSGKTPRETRKLANSLTRRMVAMAWDNPGWM